MTQLNKTAVLLALVATAFSFAGCTPEATTNRDPYMKLSTPPLVYTPPELSLQGRGAGTKHVVDGSAQQQAAPVVIDGTSPASRSTEVQFLGQPGMGPATASAPVYSTSPMAASDTMDMQPLVFEDSYPHRSR